MGDGHVPEGGKDMVNMEPIDYGIVGGSIIIWAYWYWVMR